MMLVCHIYNDRIEHVNHLNSLESKCEGQLDGHWLALVRLLPQVRTFAWHVTYSKVPGFLFRAFQ